LPIKYLCFLLGASFKAISIWDGIIQNIERCLVGRKRLYLSKRDRITLIKNTLSNLPTYLISMLLPSASIANRIEKLYQDFLWGGRGEVIKFHLVSWSKVCSPIMRGVSKFIHVQSSSYGGSGYGATYL
jgi:hypothetical protein